MYRKQQFQWILGIHLDNIKKVNITTICETTLFLFLSARYNTKIIIPKNTPLSKKLNKNIRIINTIPDDSIFYNRIISFVKNDNSPSSKFIISGFNHIDVNPISFI